MLNFLPGLAVAMMHPLYYLALEVSIELDLPSSTASYGARLSVLAIFALLFFFSLSKDGKLKANWSLLHLSLLVFLFLYLGRIYLVNESGVWNLPEAYPYSKVFPLFALGIIAPCILSLISNRLFSLPATSKVFIASTFISVVGIALLNLDQYGTFRIDGEDSIASLAMGYMAALGIGYCFLDFVRLKKYPILVLLFVLVCCVFLISLSASRGPILAMSTSVVYTLLTMEKTGKNIVSAIFVVVGGVSAAYWYLLVSGSGLLTRIDNAAARAALGEDVDARIFIYEDTIEVIKANWLFGKDIAVASGFWPHNYVLEAVMAVGIFAIFLFVPWIAALLKTFFDSKTETNQWLYVWLLQTSVMNMFTEAIWSGSLFLCIFLVLGAVKQQEAYAGNLKKSDSRKRTRRRSRQESRHFGATDDTSTSDDQGERPQRRRRRRSKRRSVPGAK